MILNAKKVLHKCLCFMVKLNWMKWSVWRQVYRSLKNISIVQRIPELLEFSEQQQQIWVVLKTDPLEKKKIITRNRIKCKYIICHQRRLTEKTQKGKCQLCCWETYSALRNTTSLTLNIVMETLIACVFKEIRNVLSWQVNCFWMLRAWCDKNMTHRYLVTKMPRLCIRKESCYD